MAENSSLKPPAETLGFEIGKGAILERVFGQGVNAMRVGLYARVSTLDQQTLPLQTQAMQAYAQVRGWKVILIWAWDFTQPLGFHVQSSEGPIGTNEP